MMNIRVIVYANQAAKSDNKRLFERFIVDWPDGTYFPFDVVKSGLGVLFSGCIVVFEIYPLNDSEKK